MRNDAGKVNVRVFAFALLVCLACLDGFLRRNWSKPSIFDALDRAKQCSTVAELESWIGEPASAKNVHDLQERELPKGAKLFDADGKSLGHGRYSIAVETDREIRTYDHPEAAGVQLEVFTDGEKIDNVYLTLPGANK